MPVLAWRNDADGFGFKNSWAFDAAERAALSGLVAGVVAPAVAAVGAAIIPDPILLTTLAVAATAAAAYPAAGGPLPTYGMCGGMAYTSLDYWHGRIVLPRGSGPNDQPARTTQTSAALRNLIWQRLLDSLTGGGVLQRTVEWSLLLNQVPGWAGGGAGTLLNRTRNEWTTLKGHIDAGAPWPIGLVYNGRSIWDQHQILVYGYEDPGDGTGTLYVYDSNSPRAYGDMTPSTVKLDFRGASLVATTPSDFGNTLAGFFCSNYSPYSPPAGLATAYGEFLTWVGDARLWMAVDGARMPIADAAELSALGATVSEVCATGAPFAATVVRPRDGALFRERSSAPVYLYQGGAPFWIPDPVWLGRFGGWGATRVVPDHTVSAFAGLPDDGTLLREWSDPKVYRIMNGKRCWVTSPAELSKYGGFPTVRLVPDGALNAIPVGDPLPSPTPGECAALGKQIQNLKTLIATLQNQLNNLHDPTQQAAIVAQIATADIELAQVAARSAILRCP